MQSAGCGTLLPAAGPVSVLHGGLHVLEDGDLLVGRRLAHHEVIGSEPRPADVRRETKEGSSSPSRRGQHLDALKAALDPSWRQRMAKGNGVGKNVRNVVGDERDAVGGAISITLLESIDDPLPVRVRFVVLVDTRPPLE